MRLPIEDVRLSGSNVKIRLRISLDPLDRGPTGARPTQANPGTGSTSSEDRLRSLRGHRRSVLRLAQTTARKE
jgi:hypothetical protein